MRIFDNPNNRNAVHRQLNGDPTTMIQVISKHQGIITVDTETKNRKRPLENHRLGDSSKVNVLSPNWMQVTHQKPGPDPLRASVINHGVVKLVRQEGNRVLTVEKDQPKRSVFDNGSFRQDLHSKELASKA